jgi:hypothetical protein
MNEELFELFLKEDCDQHAQAVLLASIQARIGTSAVEDFTFNRFNICLDFGKNEAVIDDDLNPGDGECRLPIERFANCVEAAGTK